MHSELTQAAAVRTHPSVCSPTPHTRTHTQVHADMCPCAQRTRVQVHPCVVHPLWMLGVSVMLCYVVMLNAL